ncbi:methylated-DNA--[protein]-cysteine S-methyltransferase [Robertmurraya korlensis]|uniref:methylated-DNA--[protein]-cysteine S-methyltransferase n=1 Tax=Robertmurraya korlensis TaxID=519977 RepID=UPI0020425C2C|nr:methylated-DNA--[protein]-cysteine S-methyltransferase [Robertmurraya korlensis]MCM3601815.1 methylated-DNA--[protein]-cysteine S-methyltransferase [Robertmurraya korlensis]
MTNRYIIDYQSPIGVLEIIGSMDEIYSIMFVDRDQIQHTIKEETPIVLIDCLKQIHEYFKGARQVFTVPYKLEGTEFQQTVWKALANIPFGDTDTYKELAIRINNEKAIRAVGHANSRNKLSIVIPCHRIIGSSGKLTGYAGGLWRKEWLLQHEHEVFMEKN